MNKGTKKYLIVFVITLGIFILVFGLVNFMNNQKIANIDNLQRKITADLIATETQFDLLKTAPCASAENTILSQELGELGRKLDFAQDNQGVDDADVIQLKKYYSLLQVKDYLLMKELSKKCDTNIDSLLYFYTNDCDECRKQGYILTDFKRTYPELRVYSFDTDLNFSVIDTFRSLYDFKEVYPTIIIGGKTYQGFMSQEDLEALFPKLVKAKKTAEQAEKGRKYILENRQNINKDMLSFVREKDGIFEYLVIANDQEDPEYIELVLNKETQEFEFPKKKSH